MCSFYNLLNLPSFTSITQRSTTSIIIIYIFTTYVFKILTQFSSLVKTISLKRKLPQKHQTNATLYFEVGIE